MDRQHRDARIAVDQRQLRGRQGVGRGGRRDRNPQHRAVERDLLREVKQRLVAERVESVLVARDAPVGEADGAAAGPGVKAEQERDVGQRSEPEAVPVAESTGETRTGAAGQLLDGAGPQRAGLGQAGGERSPTGGRIGSNPQRGQLGLNDGLVHRRVRLAGRQRRRVADRRPGQARCRDVGAQVVVEQGVARQHPAVGHGAGEVALVGLDLGRCDLAAHRQAAHDHLPGVQSGDRRERLEQVVGVHDPVAGVVSVQRVARRGPGEPVVDEVLAKLWLINPHLAAGTPEPVGVHHEGPVPVRRDLDPVGTAIAGDARPDL